MRRAFLTLLVPIAMAAAVDDCGGSTEGAGDGGTPSCGAAEQPCCNGTACDDGTTCTAGRCIPPCGAAGQACCNGTACNADLVCSGGSCVIPGSDDGGVDAPTESGNDATSDAFGEASFEASGESGSPVVYNEQFMQGVTYKAGDPQYDHWGQFIQALTGSYTQFTVSGTFDQQGFTCNVPGIANSLAQWLRSGGGNSITSCGQYEVGVQNCGATGMQLAIGVQTCACQPGTFIVVHPWATNAEWGGVNTATCPGPTQEMRVVFQ
jgi:hypothetical protein